MYECVCIHMHDLWPDLPKGVLYMHSFRSHFSRSFDRYNNRPTVHACTIDKASMVCFYWSLTHGPVWHPRILGWSVNGSNSPDQANSQQGITTGLAGETGHRCSYILGRVELKKAWIEAIWPLKNLYQKFLPLSGSPLPLTLHPYKNACGIDYLVKSLSTVVLNNRDR